MGEVMLEKWSGAVNEVVIGATKSEGGTRTSSITVGGQKGLPYLFAEGFLPHKAKIAFEVWDSAPADWPDALTGVYGKLLHDPLSWAQECVHKYKAELLCVRMQSAHPDCGDTTPEESADFIRKLLKKVGVPLIIVGCGDDAKDNLVLPACCEAARGERCLVGDAMQDNYKTLAAAVMADGHSIIAESPIDINIAKQLNILISDMGLPLERIVINPTIGALGYGLEYAYSIMERARLAALAGDKTVASPFICFVGQETWRAKEAWASVKDFPSWGPELARGIIWEAATAAAFLQSGADILVMRHPAAIASVSKYIENLAAGGSGADTKSHTTAACSS